MQSTIHDILAKRFDKRLKQEVPYRPDLYLADCEKLTSISAKLLLGYKKDFGSPSREDVKQFVMSNFDQKVMPHIETARVYSEDGAISVAVSLYVPTRRLEDKGAMMSIAETVFMDQRLGTTWEVKQVQGKKFLSRVINEDIVSLVNERRSRMQCKARHVTFASIAPSEPYVGKGALVRVLADDQVIKGTVVSVSSKTVKIKGEDNKSYSVPFTYVLDVIKLGPKDESKFLGDIKNYYSQIYSPDYGQEMVDNA